MPPVLLRPQLSLPPLGGRQAVTAPLYFTASGSEQTITIEPKYRVARVTMWGAGGGPRAGTTVPVAQGGFGKAVIVLPPGGCTLWVGVGQGGNPALLGTSGAQTLGLMAGGAGGAQPVGNYARGGGGGGSYIGVNGKAPANIVAACGGGGGDWAGGGGIGGGFNLPGTYPGIPGYAGAGDGGQGGTLAAGGAAGVPASGGGLAAAGSQFLGGAGGAGTGSGGRSGAGGGGGWFGGGGGGGGSDASIEGGSGGGGSGYLALPWGGTLIQASQGLPPQPDPLWNGIWGLSGAVGAAGGGGCVILELGM